MSELVIQYHDFENAKTELKEFSEQTTTDLDLRRVDDSKGFGEFFGDLMFGRGIGLNHKVTGEELNELTSQIQRHLHSVNNTQIKLIQEFRQVYNALEALDKDYIHAIVASIRATEETSEEIKKTNERISRDVENQQKTLEILKKFKQRLDGYAHLEDIDKIVVNCQKWHQEMTSLSKAISSTTEHCEENIKKIDALRTTLTVAEKRIGDLSAQISQMIMQLESVTEFTSALEKITHLQDIDEMWESLSNAHDFIKYISGEMEEIQKVASIHQEGINKLLDFTEKVSSLKHLMDIDCIWACTEEQKLHLKETDRINEGQAVRLGALAKENEKIADRVSANEENINNLNEGMNKFNSMAHLEDVDSMWNTVNEQSERLIEIEKQHGNIVTSVQENKEDVETKIAAAIQETNGTIESLTKKIKCAYWIAGGSAGLAFVELIWLLVKVI